MLKHLRQSTLLRCFVVLAFVFFLLPLSPNDAYARDVFAEDILIPGLIGVGVVVGIYFVLAIFGNEQRQAFGDDSNEEKLVLEKDKEKVLAERFAKLNTDKDNGSSPKGRVTYPVFEW